jgi:hypothetical protein
MWTGNKNNPVPNYTDKTQINPISANVVNPALDTRRDQDPRKNKTITLLDIDTAILEYLQDVINPTVVDAGQNVKVPILYGNPERWKAGKVDGFLRDYQGKIQIPAIMFKRNTFGKNENLTTLNRYLTYPVITKFSEKNKYDKFSVLNNKSAPTNQIFAVTLPDHVKVEYEFMVWTEYVEQMNYVLEKINFASEDYWGDPQRFKFRVSVGNYTNNIEVSSDKDRMVRTTFPMTVYAYLLADSFEDRKSTVQRLLTPRKVNIVAETVTSAQMDAISKEIKNKSYSNPSEPYYNTGVGMSSNNDSYKVPVPEIIDNLEKSVETQGYTKS